MKSLFVSVLTVIALVGSVASKSSGNFILRELIRELEDTQIDNPTTTLGPSTVEEDLENIGLGNNGGEDEEGEGNTEGEEGNTEGEGGTTEAGEGNTEGEEGNTEGEEGTTEAGEGNTEGEEGETVEDMENNTDGVEGETGGEEGNTEGEEGNTDGVEGNTEGEEGNTEGEEGNTEGEEGNTEGGEGTMDGGEGTTEGVKGNTEGEEGNTEGEESNTEGEESNTEGEEGNTEGEEGNTGEEEGTTDGEEVEGEEVDDDKHPHVSIEGEANVPPHSGRSTLEESAIKMTRMLVDLSRMLSDRADSLARIDKVLMDGPEEGYPGTEKLIEKQQKLEIMAAQVEEMERVLGEFFDDVFDQFDRFVSDAGVKVDGTHKPEHSKPKSNPKPAIENKPVPLKVPLPKNPDNKKVEQRQLLKRLLGVLEKSKRGM